ncbi:SDR family oxidoreductase [Albimonas sp. CAU 1670]|uniref:SDR family oxidoreductase n=1 Tax=Albimonas sp. CAU 1670 TaxID=3032599 RepID=UPI0023DCA9A9|nr:SDR family oxidoreductase [Albimonas sp. CAU 1670]MDF2231717.1 SDR family oxidoreductase [Albimonas sp. CAU 1670]
MTSPANRISIVAGALRGIGAAINLRGTVDTLRGASRLRCNDNRIVDLFSSAVGLQQPSYGVCAAARAGVEALNHLLSKALLGRYVTVNAV